MAGIIVLNTRSSVIRISSFDFKLRCYAVPQFPTDPKSAGLECFNAACQTPPARYQSVDPPLMAGDKFVKARYDKPERFAYMTSEVFFPAGFDAIGPTFKLMARLQCETFALMSRRAKAYADLSKTLACCHSPEDVMTEQVRFWQIAQRQYAESFERAVAAVPLGTELEAKPDAKSAPRRDYLVVPGAKQPTPESAASAPAAAAKLPSTEAQLPPVRVRRTA